MKPAFRNFAVHCVLMGSIMWAVGVSAETTALVNGVVIDGNGGPPIANGTVLVEDGVIAAVGQEVPVPSGATTIDLQGKTVMPGLADMHVHMIGGWDGASVDMLGYQRYLNGLLYAGVTTILDTGNVEPYILQIKRETAAGRIRGPRIYTVGALVDGADPVWPPISIPMVSTSQATAIIERQANAGVDAIKAYQGLSIPLLRALVQAAKEKGLFVIADQWTRTGSYDVAATGIAAFAHLPGRLVTAAALEQVKSGGIAFITTLAVKETFARERPGNLKFLEHPLARDTSLPAFEQAFRDYYNRELTERDLAFVERYRKGLVISKENALNLHQNGVMLVTGTDAPYPGVLMGEGVHRELELLVEIGLTPLEAISAATHNAAALMKADDWGTLEAGKRADLIVVAGRPDRDISTTRAIEMVMQGGKVLDRDELRYDSERDIGFDVSAPVD